MIVVMLDEADLMPFCNAVTERRAHKVNYSSDKTPSERAVIWGRNPLLIL